MAEPRETSRPCAVHAYHSPRPQVNHVHHILPQSWGGKDKWKGQSNLVVTCPTGHNNIHVLLGEYLRRGGKPPWKVLRQYGSAERYFAEEGWRRSGTGS